MIAIRLFHGRKTVEEEMEDWGFDGPIIIVKSFYVTYFSTFRVELISGDNTEPIEIASTEGCFYYKGNYYGDWQIMSYEDAKERVGEIILQEATEEGFL